tara:strand:+ start:402 stop:1061 length:660 start_codon:yes stop_codon:yes gene_type:complete
MSFIRHILKAIKAQGDELGFPEASEGVPTGTGGSSGAPMPHFNEGGEVDAQMNELMPPVEEEQEMLPDEDMEDDYIDFIMDEALNEEEKDMLMSKLEQDNELQMLFDKVLDVAQEFAGSGPVEGPGSGISDSIPARLSDGEFVMTAKAADQLGPENLQALMERAEQVHDIDRNAMKNGGSAVLNEDSEVGSKKAVGTTTVKEELMKRSLTNTEGAHIHS